MKDVIWDEGTVLLGSAQLLFTGTAALRYDRCLMLLRWQYYHWLDSL